MKQASNSSTDQGGGKRRAGKINRPVCDVDHRSDHGVLAQYSTLRRCVLGRWGCDGSRLYRNRRFDRLSRVGRGGLVSARQVVAAAQNLRPSVHCRANVTVSTTTIILSMLAAALIVAAVIYGEWGHRYWPRTVPRPTRRREATGGVCHYCLFLAAAGGAGRTSPHGSDFFFSASVPLTVDW